MAQRNVLESARHIVVEGPIGVGKTSLARRLASHLEAQTVLEQPELNPFLTRFYQDQARYALPTQLFFLFQRMDQLRELAQPDFFGRRVVVDYLLENATQFWLTSMLVKTIGLLAAGVAVGRVFTASATGPDTYLELPFEWPESPAQARKGADVHPPIAQYLARRPWLLPRLYAGEIPDEA